MRLLFLGDIVGRGARDEIVAQLPGWKARHRLEAVIVNAENAAHGFGVTAQICADLYKAGVDVITTGNHIWDQREIIPHIERDTRLLRPANYPETAPGRGHTVVETALGRKVLVLNVMTRLFMDPLDDPFAAADRILKQYRLGHDVQAVVLDVHGEASSEKQSMGRFCDGRASLVVGTHTHVPTADAQILPGGTGFQTDAGMCGSYEGVTGFAAPAAVARFVRKVPGEKLSPAEGAPTLCGVAVEIDPKTALCRSIHPVRVGGCLSQSPLPESWT